MKPFISTGKCRQCGGTFAKNAMTRHLKSCLRTAPAAGGLKPNQTPIKTFHLVVEGRYAPEFWLHLELSTTATLDSLDRLLRDMWLDVAGT